MPLLVIERISGIDRKVVEVGTYKKSSGISAVIQGGLKSLTWAQLSVGVYFAAFDNMNMETFVCNKSH